MKRELYDLFIKKYHWIILLIVCVTFLVSLLNLIFPWVIKVVIDNVIPNKQYNFLHMIIGILFLTFTLRFFLDYFKEYKTYSIVEKIICELREKLYLHFQKLSLSFLERKPTGEIISRIMSDTDAIKQFLFLGIADFLSACLSLIIILGVVFAINVKLTLFSLMFFPFFGIVYFRLMPKFKNQNKTIRSTNARLSGLIGEIFQGIRIVKGYFLYNYEQHRFQREQSTLLQATMNAHKLSTFLWLFSEFMTSLGLAILIYLGALEVLSKKLSAGALVAFYSYIGMLFTPVVHIVSINTYFQEAAASLERIGEIFKKESEVNDVKSGVVLKNIKGRVSFENVRFAYHENNFVLNDVSFTVEEGETIALVGPSGAGKTTIINLLLRFYDPSGGKIFIDGQDLIKLELDSYRRQTAMVLQDDFLFTGTIRENILYGVQSRKDKDVIEAARYAHAHTFIKQFPRMYDTIIGERGITLSRGQRQRLSIARAILRNPRILILDEATSAIDSRAESIIQGALYDLMKGRTTFIIAHRHSTIRHVNKIIVIENGAIVGTGSHEELYKNNLSYQRLFDNQITYDDKTSRVNI